MAAERDQEIPAARERLIQIESRYGARRAFSHTSVIQRDHNRRTMILFDQAGGHDPDNSQMPPPGRHDHRGLLSARFYRIQGFPRDGFFDLLPASIERLQPFSQLTRFKIRFGGQ